MKIFDIFYYIILGLPNALFHTLLWKKLDCDIKLYKGIVSVLILSFGFSLIHDFVSNFLRIVLILALIVIVNKILCKNNIKKSLALSFYGLIILMISELLFGIFYNFIMNNNAISMLDERLTTIIMNLIISLIAYALSQIKVVKKLYLKIEHLFYKLNNYLVLVISILSVVSINFLFVTSYYKVDIKWLVLIDSIIVTLYLIIVFKIFNTENKYIKITNKYNTTLENLKEYEEILDKYKIMNHENKNDLLMIRNMISKKDKNVNKYIDKIIDTKIKDDEKLMFETSSIPSGGLRAVIYSKMLIMKDKNITNMLHVDKAIRNIDLNSLDDEYVLDLCKVVNIFIDNAIEATNKTKKKEVAIELYLNSENKFTISISNTYKGNVDLSKIYSKGYSTNGDGRGYGLVLANKIFSKHNDLVNDTKVDNNIFKQIIILNKKI